MPDLPELKGRSPKQLRENFELELRRIRSDTATLQSEHRRVRVQTAFQRMGLPPQYGDLFARSFKGDEVNTEVVANWIVDNGLEHWLDGEEQSE